MRVNTIPTYVEIRSGLCQQNFLKIRLTRASHSLVWILKGVAAPSPALIVFPIDSILVDSQKEVIHRIANLFSQGKCPLHWIHPSLLALYAVVIEQPAFAFQQDCVIFSKSDPSPLTDWHQPSRIFQSDQKSNDFPIGRPALLSRITFVSTNNSTYPLVSPFGRLA